MATIEPDMEYEIDIPLLDLLLKDQTTGQSIIFATDNYKSKGYEPKDHITSSILMSKKRKIIRPRVEKSKAEQQTRSKAKGEVFTPSWICNKQNNLIDRAWFDGDPGFNQETENGWVTCSGKIDFQRYNKKWEDYVNDIRLEITCGEAPYLTSRYDTVTGEFIRPFDRVGLLDRKLRVISENVDDEATWIEWAKKAYQSIYGYEYQGDNLLIARENLLLDFIEYYTEKFSAKPSGPLLEQIALIITWNVFQMDGLKFVVPESCTCIYRESLDLHTGKTIRMSYPCEGCKSNNPNRHNGKYCYVMDWVKGTKIRFIGLMSGGLSNV